ncbi:hypothetical protein R1sor_026423 [Riccia sorocarpa]|uniref:P-type Cu(+) transporter n=1 Tax=Riccia sorocarpa TaxID=122646 RepID=A0ABD3GEG7_9MARC
MSAAITLTEQPPAVSRSFSSSEEITISVSSSNYSSANSPSCSYGKYEPRSRSLSFRKNGSLKERTPFLPFPPHYPPLPSVDKDEASAESRQVTFHVLGMVCAACGASIEKAVKRLPGIVDATVAVLQNRAQVVFHPEVVQEEKIREAIEDAGFTATIIQDFSVTENTAICRMRIKGMTCTSCTNSIEGILKKMEGVKKAVVALALEEGEVHYNPNLLNYEDILVAVDDAGFEVELLSAGEERNKVHLQLEGVHSQEAIKCIRETLKALPGVQTVDFDPTGEKVVVYYDPDLTGPRDCIEAIDETGPQYKASLCTQPGQGGRYREEEILGYRNSFLWSCIFTIPVFLLSMILMYIPRVKDGLETSVVNALNVGQLLRWVLSTPVQFVIGRRFYIGAYNSLRHGSANMDVLIALGTNAAYFYSVYSVLRAASTPDYMGTDFFETSAMLISFILLGKYLEILAKGKTSEAIAKLMKLTPEEAILLEEKNGVVQERLIKSQLIQRKDVIKVLPGSKVPTDGLVKWGQSHVNESMITGEARPIFKKEGDKVIGGTMNENGVLHVFATHVGSETALAQIVRLVEAAQMAKAPVQKFADRISQYFVPLVVLGALVTGVSWYVAGKTHSYPRSWVPSSMDEFQLALQFGISVLVIACPCALGLATPTAVMVATGKGAQQGVLIKGGNALESAQKDKSPLLHSPSVREVPPNFRPYISSPENNGSKDQGWPSKDELTKEDLESGMLPGKHLRGDVINAYIKERFIDRGREKLFNMFFVNTFWFPKASELVARYDRTSHSEEAMISIARLRRSISPKLHDRDSQGQLPAWIFIPIHGSNHWSLAIIRLHQQYCHIVHLDSCVDIHVSDCDIPCPEDIRLLDHEEGLSNIATTDQVNSFWIMLGLYLEGKLKVPPS